MIQKKDLDHVLELHKAQPVGSGYIDVIVKQKNVNQFVESLVSNGVQISTVTWWEYTDSLSKKPKYGMGGPKSNFYDGWFFEICFGDDEINTNKKDEILKIIQNKEIHFPDGEIARYKEQESLTPALWLEVPDEWKNIQS